MESTGYALANFMQLLLAWGIALVMYALPIIALVYVIRYLKRFAAIAEENLELNRQRTAHLE